MVTKASFAYPAVRLSEQEARVRLELYADALADLPADILGFAFMEAVKTIKFFPSIAELRTIAQAEQHRRKMLDWKPQPNPWEAEEKPPLSEEERAEVAQMVSDLRRKLSATA